MSNSDECLFLHDKERKLIKDIIFLNAYKYTEIHYLQSKFLPVTLYILYHLAFVVIVWLYTIRNYGPCGFCLGTGWQN